MIIQPKKILSQFSPNISNHIVEFCKHLSQKNCDVFIVFARKAACFVSVLEDIGLLHLNGKVVSERVLDYDTSWLKDKKVVLIDDTIISGTSIYKTIETLKKIGVKEIEVQVFCINEYWFVKEMLEDDQGNSYLKEPFLKLEHTASLKFCRDIVKAFSIHPRPYSTDFPIFESIKLSAPDINQIQSSKEWKVVGTTSLLQEDHNILCFTMNPRKKVLKTFFDELGAPVEKHSFIKLRVYAEQFTRANEKKVAYQCRILPLIIFEPVSHEFLERIISSICASEKTEPQFITQHLTTPIAKLRFIQFYFSYRFFLFCIKRFSNDLFRQLKFELNQREIELLFPPELVNIIRRFEFTNKVELEDGDIAHKFLPYQKETVVTQKLINPYEVTQLLMSQFLKLYYDKEMVARRMVKQYKKEAFSETGNRKIINRLNEGYTFGDLKRILNKEIPYDADQNLILSNFLDSTIDSGIVVPVTLDDNGYTSRGYRHGEEIIWGENNDKLLAVFFKSFLEKSQQTEIGKFWLEKSMVLFLKMGLKERILDEYTSQIAPPQTMRIMAVRSYLFGQITVRYDLKPSHETKFNPILDYEVKTAWTTQRLQDSEIITQSPTGKGFIIDTDKLGTYSENFTKAAEEPEDLDPTLISKAEEMGELIAIARTNQLLNNDGLVLLTSCLNIHDCLSSIAAELYLYSEHIIQVIDWVKSKNPIKSYTVRFLHSLRDYDENLTWTAINSGCDKYINYKDKKGEELVKTISDELGKKAGSFQRRAWDRYWKKEIDEEPTTLPDLFVLNDETGITLIEINVALTYLHVLIYELLKRKGLIEKAITGKQTEIDSRASQSESVKRKISNLQSSTADTKQVDIPFEHAQKLNELEKELEQLRKIITADEKEITYLNEYANNNIARVRSYEAVNKKLALKDMPFNEERMKLVTKFYQSFTDDELTDSITGLLGTLSDYKTKATDILLNFSSLVPQWGKLNPIARYTCLIHLTTKETTLDKRNLIKQTALKVVEEFNFNESPNDSVKSAVVLRPNETHTNQGLFIGGKGSYTTDRMTKLAGKIAEECLNLNLQFQLHFFPFLEGNNIIKAYYNKSRKETDEVHEDFYPSFENMESQFLAHENCLLLYNTSKGKIPNDYKTIIRKEISGTVKFDVLKYLNNSGHMEDLIRIDIGKQAIVASRCIGVVTALPIEFAAMKAMLDFVDTSFKKPEGDSNDYARGFIRNKNGENVEVILVVCKEMGNNHSTAAVTNLIRSFEKIEDVIMTGIAGAIPDVANPKNHVRLGDIVVTDKHGILQYDNLKETSTTIEIRSTSQKPSATLIGLTNVLEADSHLTNVPWNEIIEKTIEKYPKFKRPEEESDILTIKKIGVTHPNDPDRVPNQPKVFRGPIGSANLLLKNEDKRDILRDQYKVKAIEMEGSGIADGTWEAAKGYLVVRSTVDYCNDDKNNDWHSYGALIAAAYTKCVIQLLS